MWGPHSAFALVAAVYAGSVMEFYRMHRVSLRKENLLAVGAGALFLLQVYLTLNFRFHWMPLLACAMLLAMPLPWLKEKNLALQVIFWLAIPMAAMYALGWTRSFGHWSGSMPLGLMILLWLNDSLAYLFGSVLGSHALAPRISPGKTWEGFFGGLLSTAALSVLLPSVLGVGNWKLWLPLAVLTGILGLLGDLHESRLKRRCQVKDSGRLLPGHGGLLDRFDSLFFVSVPSFLLVMFLSLLP